MASLFMWYMLKMDILYIRNEKNKINMVCVFNWLKCRQDARIPGPNLSAENPYVQKLKDLSNNLV